jgi:hypothetical protein
MRLTLTVAVLAAVLVTGGCAHTDVVDMGSGCYSLTAAAPSGGYGGSHEEAIERANKFCGRHGQAAETDGFHDQSELGPQGEHTSAILFRCVTRQALQF